MKVETKFRVGRYLFPVVLDYQGERIFVSFRYSKPLIAEIKSMAGSKWHGFSDPPRKIWSISNCQRNHFQLEYLQGNDPYAKFDTEIKKHTFERPLFDHQKEFVDFILARKQCIIAGEMGTGKSLAAIEVMDRVGGDWWFVAPRSALRAVERELMIWKSKVRPRMVTYEGLVKWIKERAGQDITDFPQGVVFDESARIKNPTAQRSQASAILADLIRENDGYIVLMSGAPAPKSPIDWWHQCLSKDTWILTSTGPEQIKNLIGKHVEIRVQGKNYKTDGFFATGMKQLYRLETFEGHNIEATIDHRFQKTDQTWCVLGDLKSYDTIKLANHSDFNWDGFGSFGDGYILGLLFGDGHIYEKGGKYYGCLQFFDEDYHLIEYLKEYFPNDFNVTGTGPWRINGGYISQIIRNFDFDTKKRITTLFESTISSDCLRGFLSGFFDADGSVSKDTLRVTLAQVDQDRIYTIQRMLTYFGICSRIQVRQQIQNSSIAGRQIQSKETNYVLHITNDDAKYFNDRIGFNHKEKQRTLRERITNRHNWPAHSFATVKRVVATNVEAVFDIEVPEIHTFAANGLLAHNCEVACPGFLKEGNKSKFQRRLGIVTQKEFYETGKSFSYLESWLDDERKCEICGQFEEDHSKIDLDSNHTFKASKNEVSYLYERMNGLVLVKLKKDCLDLPDMHYNQIILEPSQKILNLARTIMQTAKTTIAGITLLRELSDGFQYHKEVVGEETCPICLGKKELPDPLNEGQMSHCDGCGGKGTKKKYARTVSQIETPKEGALRDLLDEYIEVGRVVIFGGFTGTVDRCVQICKDNGWETIRVDGRGWEHNFADPLETFQNQQEAHPYVAFIGQAGAGGMGLTLTSSPVIIYYSNSFNAEDRVQSEARIHRIGMDINKGATIIDLIHLATDELILENLKKKRQLQSLSMGELQRALA